MPLLVHSLLRSPDCLGFRMGTKWYKWVQNGRQALFSCTTLQLWYVSWSVVQRRYERGTKPARNDVRSSGVSNWYHLVPHSIVLSIVIRTICPEKVFSACSLHYRHTQYGLNKSFLGARFSISFAAQSPLSRAHDGGVLTAAWRVKQGKRGGDSTPTYRTSANDNRRRGWKSPVTRQRSG
jgi:hypothetical protein